MNGGLRGYIGLQIMDATLYCLGLNYRTAPVGLRERLSLSDDQTSNALDHGVNAGRSPLFEELVILSTCNRIELYAGLADAGFPELEAFLSSTCGVPPDQIDAHLYRLSGIETARHLLRVAAGLDSPVLGEAQILGQVARALALARSASTAGPILTRLFLQAVHAGKRARAETGLSRRPASLPALAASLADESTPGLPQAQIVILGAGEMAEGSTEALRKHGAGNILVLNRSLDHARRLAQRWKAEAGSFGDLASALRRADILIASVGASRALVPARMVAEALSARPGRPLLAIDLAVPRNIEPEAARIPGVRLYDIDQLNQRLSVERASREQEVPKVEAILAQEEAQWLEFRRVREVAPLIAGLQRKAEAIRRDELRKTLRRLPDLSDAELARIDSLTQAIVNKMLHAPIARLKDLAGQPGAADTTALASELFDIGPGAPVPNPETGIDPPGRELHA